MTSRMEHYGGLVCIPGAIEAADRPAHFALAKELFTELAQERTDLENGYAFRFAPDALEKLSRFVANERKCCPFLGFELTIAPESGPLWLCMSGPQGTRVLLDAELGLPASCGCGR